MHGSIVSASDIEICTVERLVPKSTIEIKHPSLEDDLTGLQDILENDVPMYILARLGGQGDQGWLAINYIPDTDNVRGKVCLF